MTTSRIAIFVVVSAMLVLISCGKRTAKSESGRFKNAEKKAKGLASVYPAFQSLVDKRVEKAREVLKAAEKISDEEAKVKKMTEAVSTLNAGFVDKLSRVDGALKDLRREANKVVTEVTSEADRLAAKNAAEDAQRVMKNADELLRKGAKDEIAAEGMLERILDDLRESDRNIDKILSKVRAAKRKAAAPPINRAKPTGKPGPVKGKPGPVKGKPTSNK